MIVLQVNKFYFPRGGTEQYVSRLSQWLEGRGHTVVPFAMQHPQNHPTSYASFFPRYVPTEDARFSLAAIRTLGRLFFSRESAVQMRRLVEHVRPNVAHVHNVYTQLSPSVLLSLNRARVPTLMTVHDYHLVSPQYNVSADPRSVDLSRLSLLAAARTRFHKGSFLASLLQAASFSYARRTRVYERCVDRFVVPCAFLKGKMVAAGYDRDRITVLAHGIDTTSVRPRYDDDGYVVFIGRLIGDKGIDTVLDLAKALPDIPFKIVGTGPEEARVHAIGHTLPNVTFCGFQQGEALHALLSGARVMLVPSRVHEVFPLTVLEAFAAGTTVIASAVGGIPEAIDDRVTGMLVPAFDRHAWIEALVRVFYDEPLRLSMARAARRSAEERFSLRKHFQEIERLYQRVVELSTEK